MSMYTGIEEIDSQLLTLYELQCILERESEVDNLLHEGKMFKNNTNFNVLHSKITSTATFLINNMMMIPEEQLMNLRDRVTVVIQRGHAMLNIAMNI